jgi:hypothetical protein
MPDDFKKKPIIEKHLEKFEGIRRNIESPISLSSTLNFFHKYGSLISQLFRNADRKTLVKNIGSKVSVALKNKVKSKFKRFTSKFKPKILKNVKNKMNR